jgi:hypothetical protein
MTHFDGGAELDALLRFADEAVLTAVEDGLDLDAGRAVLCAQVTVRDRGDRQPPAGRSDRTGASPISPASRSKRPSSERCTRTDQYGAAPA